MGCRQRRRRTGARLGNGVGLDVIGNVVHHRLNLRLQQRHRIQIHFDQISHVSPLSAMESHNPHHGQIHTIEMARDDHNARPAETRGQTSVALAVAVAVARKASQAETSVFKVCNN
ncbi:hypothetical protein Mkiyose1665_11350 [Mycobacterium kiyosense]|uniref:Uncharacterized protein n=1 Tax=Mycobacterium kiyosense TaxID=2871094 RepID=A0A9P3QCP5_9MYCO|nr:hypothetical protein IWGMT90018_17110 [Mycobacterium kiyosense]BDE13022.1 hypothetical protein MKCMC460_18820 [Mycobacterium sp. 20KCMC460]GLB85084.1 hypothetical protein SRL2020028_43400 [Mycobacterium kiyosense]GLB92117.1 hypothetical protein SRL2020130_49340 [Mycobacterium kiyosense]GLB97611.1 hypothetical protein SRL2020226_43870 [Mycobacterium kiyosense]